MPPPQNRLDLAAHSKGALTYVIYDWNFMRRSILYFVFLGVIVSVACRERIIVYPPPRVPDTAPPPTRPVSPPKGTEPIRIETISPATPPPPTLSHLDVGMIHFRQGEYLEAIEDYKAYLEDNPRDDLKDATLYYLGLSYALSPGSDRNLAGAKSSMNQILKEFPESDYKSEAELILNLVAELEQRNMDVNEQEARIQKIQDELDRLKEIDLKRRPSRPTDQ
jgi:tetratricopeptide (TPR) repeat protein